MIDYTLTRSKRRSIGIYVTKKGTVEVRAPLKTKIELIDKFVQSKTDWILKHLQAKKQLLEQSELFELNYGSIITLQGKSVKICVGDNCKASLINDNFYIKPNLTSDELKAAVVKLYNQTAKQVLAEKIAMFAEQMAVRPTAVKVNSAKTRWGSCSGKNSINFSWRLILADDDVIDYVVVHELAHIKQHNHSSSFWEVVASVLPDYKIRQSKLKGLQKILSIQNWD